MVESQESHTHFLPMQICEPPTTTSTCAESIWDCVHNFAGCHTSHQFSGHDGMALIFLLSSTNTSQLWMYSSGILYPDVHWSFYFSGSETWHKILAASVQVKLLLKNKRSLNHCHMLQVQWRFVNRAIDEVENGRVSAVLLICRNSTDTAYFQRLTPYPRVLLRRHNAQCKDYDKSPIGFGIVVFCIAKNDCGGLYDRFIRYFGPWGEPNIVIDAGKFFSEPF